MKLLLSQSDLRKLTAPARAEILAILFPRDLKDDPEFQGFDMYEVVDLDETEVEEWLRRASPKTISGLRVFAEGGPVVRAQALIDAGIENLSHFQSRTTIRTRTVTGNKGAFLLGWDDWDEVEEGEGRYAVTPRTHRSLRYCLGLDR